MFSRGVWKYRKIIIWLNIKSLTDADQNSTTIKQYDASQNPTLYHKLMRVKILRL